MHTPPQHRGSTTRHPSVHSGGRTRAEEVLLGHLVGRVVVHAHQAGNDHEEAVLWAVLLDRGLAGVHDQAPMPEQRLQGSTALKAVGCGQLPVGRLPGRDGGRLGACCACPGRRWPWASCAQVAPAGLAAPCGAEQLISAMPIVVRSAAARAAGGLHRRDGCRRHTRWGVGFRV